MVKPFTSDDLLLMRWVGNPRLSYDGEALLFEVTEVRAEDNCYQTNIWMWVGGELFPFAQPGCNNVVSNTNPAWRPNCRDVAFLSNRTGSRQLWLYRPGRGEAQQLTQVEAGVTDYCWSHDGRYIFYRAKEKQQAAELRKNSTARRITRLRYKHNGAGYLDNTPHQLYGIDVEHGTVRQLTTDTKGCGGTPVPSPCGRLIAFCDNRSDNEQDLTRDVWLLSLEDGTIKRLTDGKGAYYSPVWTPDGRCIICLGYEKAPCPGGYPRLWLINVDTAAKVCLAPSFEHCIGYRIGNDASWDRGNSGLQISEDGEQIYFLATVGGNSHLFCLNRSSGAIAGIVQQDNMVVTSFDVKGGQVAANVATPCTPGDIWLGTYGEKLEQITRFNAKLFKTKYIAKPERILFTNPEGVQLEGWLLKPFGFCDSEKYPVIMEIHGGPHSAYGNIFFHEFQILAGHGYGVFYSNPRGSLGYGRSFARSIIGDWCGKDADDLEFMAREISKIEWVDENRLGVTGGSQGGYFTNWLISHTNLFAAAVTQRSMSNLYTKYGVADNGWNGDRYGMGGADLWEDEDFIMERSPIRYAPQVNTPLLIIHSDQDYRCPLEQAEQWYVALKRLGNTTEMLLFHGENHELSRSGKPVNRLVRLDAILDWFDRFLK